MPRWSRPSRSEEELSALVHSGPMVCEVEHWLEHEILLVSYCLQLYSFAFHAARSADSSGRSRPSQKIGHSWNHFSRLQIECTDLLCPKSA